MCVRVCRRQNDAWVGWMGNVVCWLLHGTTFLSFFLSFSGGETHERERGVLEKKRKKKKKGDRILRLEIDDYDCPILRLTGPRLTVGRVEWDGIRDGDFTGGCCNGTRSPFRVREG